MPRTRLNSEKLLTLAQTAAFLVKRWRQLPDQHIAHEMLREGVRKLHDNTTSHRGTRKYLGHADWSQNALLVLRRAGGNIDRARNKLRHEHVVPVNVVVDLLIGLGRQASTDSCAKLIRRYSRVAIITRAEDRLLAKAHLSTSMPENWNGHDIWARYRRISLYAHITDA